MFSFTIGQIVVCRGGGTMQSCTRRNARDQRVLKAERGKRRRRFLSPSRFDSRERAAPRPRESHDRVVLLAGPDAAAGSVGSIDSRFVFEKSRIQGLVSSLRFGHDGPCSQEPRAARVRLGSRPRLETRLDRSQSSKSADALAHAVGGPEHPTLFFFSKKRRARPTQQHTR